MVSSVEGYSHAGMRSLASSPLGAGLHSCFMCNSLQNHLPRPSKRRPRQADIPASCSFSDHLPQQKNGKPTTCQNASRPALRGGVRRQVGALRPPALSCTVFNPSVHTPNTEQSPARISGLTAIPIGTPAQSPHTAFQAGGGVRMPARRQNAPQGQAGHICGVSIAVISDSISAANSSRDCPYFSRQYWPILSRIALFSSALSW